MGYLLTYKIAFSFCSSYLAFILRGQDSDAKFNISYHNDAPVADILKVHINAFFIAEFERVAKIRKITFYLS